MRLRPFAGTLLSTAGIGLAVPPMEWSPLIWIAFVPWLLALGRCRSTAEAAVQGFWLDFLLGFTAPYWLASAVPEFFGAARVVGWIALVAHAVIHQLQLVAFAALFWWLTRARAAAGAASLVLPALLYTGIDWATPKVFADTIGFTLHDLAVWRQLAGIGGAEALTFAVLFVNLGLFAVVRAAFAERGRGAGAPAVLRAALRVGAGCALLYGLAAWEGARVGAVLDAPARRVDVGFVQGNADGELKQRWALGDDDAAREFLDVYLSATRRLLEGPSVPDFVIWPETTYPGVFRKPESDAQLLLNVAFDRAVAAAGVPILFGGYDREDRTDRRVLRNALYIVTPKRNQAPGELSPMQVYHKSILMPVGETFPGLDRETLRAWFPSAGDFGRGEGARVFEVSLPSGESVRLGPAICYEDLYPDFTATIARGGAELLVNISNDGWIGDYAARFHLIFARLRSIETRLPQIRVTNSGFSALILPDGELRNATDFGVAAAEVVSVPLFEPIRPPRVRLGDWLGPTSLAVAIVGLLWRRRRS